MNELVVQTCISGPDIGGYLCWEEGGEKAREEGGREGGLDGVDGIVGMGWDGMGWGGEEEMIYFTTHTPYFAARTSYYC